MEGIDVQAVVKQALEEFVSQEQAKNEPAYKAELVEERRRREQLERKLNEVIAENKRNRQLADEADRRAAVQGELQKLGVAKVDLAFKAVQDSIVRGEDGRLVARGDQGEQPLREYLTSFVNENPEFLPARIAGGSGVNPAAKTGPVGRETVSLEQIRPGMTAEEMQRVREEILRVASGSMRI